MKFKIEIGLNDFFKFLNQNREDAIHCVYHQINSLNRYISVFLQKLKMQEENPSKKDFSTEDEKKFARNGMRQYAAYSAVVFQMLATMGLAFWGGKKINDHFDIESNLLTVGIGFLGMGLAFYNLLNQLKKIQGNETKK